MNEPTRETPERDRIVNRRAVLQALGTGLGVSLAGCSGSRIDGAVASNETPLSFSHEYATQATYSGTRVFVDVTAENAGNDPITLETRVPNTTCTFLDAAGETLHEAGIELVEPLNVGESTALEFPLTIDTEDVTRYELRCAWVEG
jgi:hypothetical protein